ncbi:hypothetical protein DL89DRAFT_267848 [Linderina pennispora]|uniref:Uncharacterized protein n=1 Tax=Linderina pennispora TaxID=61395 RepID=A0A1Y1W8U3_9FUNG|nr:uncharacterized protein DL89DRAFT_267848 [Linderina pennispora]ORX69666.1 hypothetical protein DL89DRAFT_267848 [Linderina pennispora]
MKKKGANHNNSQLGQAPTIYFFGRTYGVLQRSTTARGAASSRITRSDLPIKARERSTAPATCCRRESHTQATVSSQEATLSSPALVVVAFEIIVRKRYKSNTDLAYRKRGRRAGSVQQSVSCAFVGLLPKLAGFLERRHYRGCACFSASKSAASGGKVICLFDFYSL